MARSEKRCEGALHQKDKKKPQQSPRHAGAWRGGGNELATNCGKNNKNAKGKLQSNEFEESNCEPASKRSNKGVELLSRGQIKARKRDAPNWQGLNDEKTKRIQLQRAKHRIQSAAQREARSEVPEGHWRLQQMHQLRIKLNDERQGGSKRASSEVACHESSTKGLT